MSPSDRSAFRERLLAAYSPEPRKLDLYRREVAEMLERRERNLKREKWLVGAIWLLVVLLSTAFMTVAGFLSDTSKATWFGITAVFWLLFGTVFLLKYFLNDARIELLKELKAIELRLAAMEERLGRSP